MNIGSLRHRVTIEERGSTPDDFGEEIPTWDTVASRWAAIEPLQGREYWLARQTNAETTHKLTMWAAGLTLDPTMRISYGSRIFAIESFRDLNERGKKLEVMAVEKLS